MMTREQCLLVCAAEECAELAQRLTKAARFGMHEMQPGQDLDNRDRILAELTDLLTVLGMAQIFVIEIEPDEVAEKREKVERYLAYSVECGTVQP